MSNSNLIDDILKDIDPTIEKQYDSLNFNVRVGCIKMAAPRHPRFEWFLNMGQNDIDCLFSDQSFSSDKLTFVFPERFMSVQEQHSFTQALINHKDTKSGKLKSVDIITSSPMIIGCFHRETIRVISFNDDQKHNGEISIENKTDSLFNL